MRFQHGTTAVLLMCMVLVSPAVQKAQFRPGQRVLVDAHNCYPYDGRWADRIDRALRIGTPLAIEQDLFWFTDSGTGRSWSIVAHGKDPRGDEPTLRSYFLERIRPIMEQALGEGNKGDWPLITLNLDFKSNEPAHLRAIWNLLGEYEDWLSTAERVQDGRQVMPINVKPLLVLSGDSDTQAQVFHDEVPVGRKLRVFGAVHVSGDTPNVPPDVMVPGPATNYRRWWNNPWSVVERGGQQGSGKWTRADRARLQSLVDHAHRMGLWIRFYTLDGGPEKEFASQGWFQDYNFGTRARVERRWRAAIRAGVDFIATDEYEALAGIKQPARRSAKTIAGRLPPPKADRI